MTRIHGQPTTVNLIKLQREIRANAITVHTTLGGGHPGNLCLVWAPETYGTILNTQTYNLPAAPGALNVAQGATQVQISQTREQHAE